LQTSAEVVVGTQDHATALAMQYLYRDSTCQARLLEMLHADIESEFLRLQQISPVVTAATAINDTVVREIEQRVPRLSEKVFRWYCPVPCPADPPSRPREAHTLHLFYSGRVIQWEKRVLDLVPIAAKLMERGIDFHLTVAGDGPELKELKVRLRQSGVGDRCSFPGWVDSARLQEMLSSQDLFLLPSDVESMGFSLLEAMAHGVIPVVTNLPGPAEVVLPDTGFLVPVGDVEAFVEVISCAAAGRVPLEPLRLAAWQLIRDRYSIDVATASYAEMLARVATLPLPAEPRVCPPTYPHGRMDKLRVPQCIQALRRRWTGHEVVP
jgi:glycosyltransferase involved in cell wall biosynthesis